MDQLNTDHALDIVLELTEQQATGLRGAQAHKAEALAGTMLENMARQLGNAAELHLGVLIILAGETLGRGAVSAGDLTAAAEDLRKAVIERGLARLVRGALDELAMEEVPDE